MAVKSADTPCFPRAGKFFLSWYSGKLVQHLADMADAVVPVVEGASNGSAPKVRDSPPTGASSAIHRTLQIIECELTTLVLLGKTTQLRAAVCRARLTQ